VEEEGPLRAFVEEVRGSDPPVYRAPGTAVFLNANPETTPLALRANVEHNHVLHECVLIVSLSTERMPYIAEDDRLSIDDLGYRDDGITHITGRYGFQDPLDVPALLRLAARRGVEGDPELANPSYFVSRIQIVVTERPGMARWRKRLFLAISRNAADPVEVFHLPDERTVVMGSHIEL
jgi:KUP system potassium uptake protein